MPRRYQSADGSMSSGIQTMSVLDLRLGHGAPLRRAVLHLPERPHVVDMPRVLTGIRRRRHQLRAPEMADRAVALGEHGRDRLLHFVLVLGVVVAVVRVVLRREET